MLKSGILMYRLNRPTSTSCAECGSELILINTVTEKLTGTLFPQTTSTYRCSNAECQERRDKELEKRLKVRQERVDAEQKRLEERKLKKRVKKV